MSLMPDHVTPERWLAQIFASGEARRGGVVKRQVSDVERLVGRSAFAAEVARRGYQAVENGRHFVIFCNGSPVLRVRAEGPVKALPERSCKSV
ncbi:N-(5'-phosphoribosyl)anthranilate isomerase [Maribius pontilimi]|uniref:N-(5'-phosphoribosyl)anthranilate isomerase n=1 Tax=Palleronia pontilimi TaxID=1964209 RepID=A0A934MCE3_9RHOB|nr:N-(5'-phosphoribosyl)anthranilate isomerase [Palleronia pontilimi]MBJ3762693.1 N-(5'-phosphoribosyl)anthranilate isomerase [Palleronia pontilimi]